MQRKNKDQGRTEVEMKIIQRTNETKNQFFKKIGKFHKRIAKLNKKKKRLKLIKLGKRN